MASPPGFDVPQLASYPPAGNLYYSSDVAVGGKVPAQQIYADPQTPGHAQAQDVTGPPPLFFESESTAATPAGHEAVVNSANQTTGKGHVAEILNFRGSPAPWILIAILIVAGLLHLSASAKFKGQL